MRAGSLVIEIRGLIENSSYCTGYSAAAVRGTGMITLTVTAKRTGEVCPAVIVDYAYAATIGNVPAGPTRVRVRYADDARVTDVLDQTVQVVAEY